jgi:2,3-dihydroxy-p-cumate/2,3-dihydroxybenzoate 3,4-dioxygenase
MRSEGGPGRIPASFCGRKPPNHLDQRIDCREAHMIDIEQLRYVRLGTRDLGGAAQFAQRTLGLELVEQDDTQAAFRSDFRDHTLVFTRDLNAAHTIGLEVRDAEALERAADVLAQGGYEITAGSPEEASRRKVKTFLSFDAKGVTIDLVVRPLHSGWRYFPSRDAGITGLEAVALRSTSAAKDEALWTKVLSGKVSDWVGDAAYIRFDDAHHRIALHPSTSAGVLAVEFAVETVDQLMQSSYFLQDQQVRMVHGPGRRPASGQMFLTFTGPDGVLFSYVAEGRTTNWSTHRPRQFARRPRSFCAWGSRSDVPEFDPDLKATTLPGGRS